MVGPAREPMSWRAAVDTVQDAAIDRAIDSSNRRMT
jgi:hypothetical protein